MEKMLGNKKYILIFILPALLLFLGFTLIPLITSGVYSFFEYNGIGSKTFIGIKNYIELFTSDRYFPQAVKNSLILVSASLFIQLPISLILALILSKGVKGDNFFRTIYFIPVVISSMVIGQLWLKMFNSDYGVINTVIRHFVPEYEHSWLTKNAFMTVLIPSVPEMCMPGDNVKMDVELITPIAIEAGLRFAIREGGRTVGAGVVSEIEG